MHTRAVTLMHPVGSVRVRTTGTRTMGRRRTIAHINTIGAVRPGPLTAEAIAVVVGTGISRIRGVEAAGAMAEEAAGMEEVAAVDRIADAVGVVVLHPSTGAWMMWERVAAMVMMIRTATIRKVDTRVDVGKGGTGSHTHSECICKENMVTRATALVRGVIRMV